MPVPSVNCEIAYQWFSNYNNTGSPVVVLYCKIGGSVIEYALTYQTENSSGGKLTDSPAGTVSPIEDYNPDSGATMVYTIGVTGSDGYVYGQVNIADVGGAWVVVGNFTARAGVQYEIAVLDNILAVCQGGTTWNALQVV